MSAANSRTGRAGRAFGAAAGGVVLLPVFCWLMLMVLLGSSYTWLIPDPAVLDGDPCCGHPDTWGEVRWSLVVGMIAIWIPVLVLSGSVSLFSSVVTDRLRWRWKYFAIAGGVSSGLMVASALLIHGTDLLTGLL